MKKVIYTIVFTLMFSMSVQAQIFIIDESKSDRVESNGEFVIVNPINHGSGEDWYVPLGDGALLFAGLASAYLLGKKKKK